MPNRLIDQKSPYLLQHAENPVDWYPWGEEALEKAKREDKPIFLSIGYATCHWCHVMAHESFEDGEVADALNKNYVSIKVDREERPDVDQVYMTACQAMTGSGGWPLTILMAPDGKPFFIGTYFPRITRLGMPGFLNIINHFSKLWAEGKSRLLEAAESVTRTIQPEIDQGSSVSNLELETLKLGYEQHAKVFDQNWGGFGKAPKFPSPHHLTFLLRWYRRTADSKSLQMVEKTLKRMRQGGIFDQLGFGFHRYSVDERWLVPHFEKMLYDQALLSIAYLEAFQATGQKHYADVAGEVFTYVLRDMTAPEGGFWSAEDADSEGREGAFYLWTPQKVKRELGKETGELFSRFYDISEAGNFENGESIPHVSISLEEFAAREGLGLVEFQDLLKKAARKLFLVRKKRVHPLKDDKILTSWNGLMIAALARGYQVMGDQAYSLAASCAADFILDKLARDRGRLMRRYRQGDVKYNGYLDDYAFMVWGLIELYEATFELSWLERALDINQAMIDLFWDFTNGGFYSSGRENEALITRTKEIYDSAIPSGNSVAALNLIRLGRMTGNTALEEKAEQLIRTFSNQVAQYPMACTQFLAALDFIIGPSQEIVIAGNPEREASRALIQAIRQRYLPNKVLLLRAEGQTGERLADLAPYVSDLPPSGGKPQVYLCQGYACQTPIEDPAELEKALEGAFHG
ncbi:MAG: thioredoxin domain-containing protein [Deltaproteobacteria bacterium]|nr:thioredoxin domain-containing protein [Deltaproteobacteria bacterium]